MSILNPSGSFGPQFNYTGFGADMLTFFCKIFLNPNIYYRAHDKTFIQNVNLVSMLLTKPHKYYNILYVYLFRIFFAIYGLYIIIVRSESAYGI